jgi:hypothetical protein
MCNMCRVVDDLLLFRPLSWTAYRINHRTSNLIFVHKELHCVVVASVRHYKVTGDTDIAKIIQIWV